MAKHSRLQMLIDGVFKDVFLKSSTDDVIADKASGKTLTTRMTEVDQQVQKNDFDTKIGTYVNDNHVVKDADYVHSEFNFSKAYKQMLDALTDNLTAITKSIPSNLSQMKNDDNTVKDASYVHTDNNFSNEQKIKLDGLGTQTVTKISELDNDDFTVKDQNYVHTDNNLTNDLKLKLDGLKDLQQFSFTAADSRWAGNVLTIAVNVDSYLLVLYRQNANGKLVIDSSNSAYVENGNLVVNATEPFAGYAIVCGQIEYDNLQELFALLLNEDSTHTYTLDEIIGVAYKEPVYPDKDQLALTMSEFYSRLESLSSTISTAVTNAKTYAESAQGYLTTVQSSADAAEGSANAASGYKDSAQAALSKSKEITLAAATWASAAYTISDTEIKAASVLSIQVPTACTLANYDAVQAAKLVINSQADGSVVIGALGTVPTVDVTIRLIISGVIS